MKTLNSIFIRTAALALAIGIFASMQSLFAQGKEKEKIRVIVCTNENGTTARIDTTFDGENEGDINGYLNGLDLPSECNLNLDSLLTSLQLDIHETPDGDSIVAMVEVITASDTTGLGDVHICGTGTDSVTQVICKKICINASGAGPDSIITIMVPDDGNGDTDGANKSERVIIRKCAHTEGDEGDAKVCKGKRTVIVTSCDGNDDKSAKAGGKNTKTIIKTHKSKNGENTEEISCKVIICEPAGNDKNLVINNTSGAAGHEMKVDEFNFAPNPSDGKFNLTFATKGKGDTEIKIVGMDGKQVYTETLKNFSGRYSKEINLSPSSKGAYILIVTQGESIFTKKLVVK